MYRRDLHSFPTRRSSDLGAAMPMEGRGVVARWEAYEGMLTCWISTQGPIPLRNGLAAIFHLPEHKVRVIAPDVGGGFGRSEEHTSELQSRQYLVCRLLLE